MKLPFKNANWWIVIAGIVGLGITYTLQSWNNPYAWLQGEFTQWKDTWETLRYAPKSQIIINKAFRYLLNDFFSILLIHGLFQKKLYTQFAIWVLVFGLFVLLPSYLAMVFYAPSGYSSMISHFHRIIMNPVLMMLLIPYFFMLEKTEHS